MDELRKAFRPEFLNRVDEIVLFKPLRPSEIEKIVDLLAAQLRKRLADREITLEITPAARRHLAEQGFDPVYGARPLRRFMQRELETRIGRAIVAGQISDGAAVTVDLDGGKLVVRSTAPAGSKG